MYGLYEWTAFDGFKGAARKPCRRSDSAKSLEPDYAGSHWVIATSVPTTTDRGWAYQVVKASSDWARERFLATMRA